MKELQNQLLGKYQDFKISVDSDGLTMESLNDYIVIGWINHFSEIKIREKIILSKRFDEVEEILEPILSDFKILECGYGGFNHTINQFVNFSQEPIQIDLKNSTNFNGFTNRIDYLLENEFQEFRKKNTSIERVHEISESITPQELGNYLRQPPAFRRMIIKKLIDNKDYEDFAIKYIESAKVKASQKSAFRNYDLAADSLYKSLKSF